MDRLSQLENQSIYIIREAYAQFKRLAVLWSIGKDSTVMLWLIRKAFCGHIPFPAVHIDTTYKIPEMITYRDRFVKKWRIDLKVNMNKKALQRGMGPHKGKVVCCDVLKTRGLQQLIKKEDYHGLFLGIRRDEEGTRAKERFFSPRDIHFEWNFKDQMPEIWDQFNTHFDKNTHIRIHPILHWTELDVWEYIKREKIPIIDLYFAKRGRRYRSLGCACCTAQIASRAKTVDKIIKELKKTTHTERQGRAQDHESTYAMQKLRVKGYM
ncbi:MAG: sulfate adenylyltransferase subunit 2 [Candidatus Omnitrophica bacterium]|nr:sulfate adenylyltransferase subunit 2 [Candidatus Omnitrophota bacterium]